MQTGEKDGDTQVDRRGRGKPERDCAKHPSPPVSDTAKLADAHRQVLAFVLSLFAGFSAAHLQDMPFRAAPGEGYKVQNGCGNVARTCARRLLYQAQMLCFCLGSLAVPIFI